MNIDPEFMELWSILDEIREARKPKPKKPRKKTAKQLQLEEDIRTAQMILQERKQARGEAPLPDPNALDLRISQRLPKVAPTVRILEFIEGKGWKPATLTAAEREAELKRLEEERTGLREIPTEVWE
jgi:hypothetical protein